MQQDLTMEERIQAYIDQDCTEAERVTIEQKIATQKVWADHYHALMAVHELLSSGLEPMEPSMRFTKNVMDDIAGLEIARPVRQFMSPWIFRIAGGILGAILIFIVFYSLSLVDFSAGSSTTQLPIPEMKMPEVQWGKYINQSTTLLLFMVCTVLGFFLLDKWLMKRNKMERNL